MLYVDKNNVIRLTRGDTAKFIVTVKNETTQEPYDILPTYFDDDNQEICTR